MNVPKTAVVLILGLWATTMNAQRVVSPTPQDIPNRFKENVPSTVLKGNPLTLLFGYADLGTELRNANSGWVVMHHSYFGRPTDNGQSFVEPYYEQTNYYARISVERRLYRQRFKRNGFPMEKYTGFYVNTGYTSLSYTYDVQPGNFGYLPVGTLTDAGRIDMMAGIDLGRTRDMGMANSPWYWETSWKLGYNFSAQSPQILYGIRANFKLN